MVGPAVALRSPAMTTPSLYRMATMVVPWRISKAGSPPGSGARNGSSPIFRSRAVKLGPGSSWGGNGGRLIGRSKPYRPASPSEHKADPGPLGVAVVTSALAQDEVCGRGGEQFRILVELAEALVAVAAQQGPDLTGRVVVVDVERLALGRPGAADPAPALLLAQHLVVLVGRQPELPLQVSTPLRRLHLRSLTARPLSCVVSFSVLLLPLLHSRLAGLGIGKVLLPAIHRRARLAFSPTSVLD